MVYVVKSLNTNQIYVCVLTIVDCGTKIWSSKSISRPSVALAVVPSIADVVLLLIHCLL